jgi:hypothetical protein
MVQRGVALAQGYRIAEVIEDGKQLAKPPDSRLIERLRRHAAFAPQPFQRAGVWAIRPLPGFPAGILHLEQVPANGATKVGLGVGSHDLRTAAETAKLMKIVVHAQVINYPDASLTAWAYFALIERIVR